MQRVAGTESPGHPPAQLWGLLGEETRLRVFAALALGSRSIGAIAEHAGVEPRLAVRALRRLERGGIVRRDGTDVELRRDVLAEQARRTSHAPAPYVEPGLPPAAAAVLRSFLRDGRLTTIPAGAAKRAVVLDHVARVFEIGVRYPEREVATLLRAFHPDHAALRRYLVDGGFLSREAGVYWRSGGTVQLGD